MDRTKFELFADLLEHEKVYMDPGLSFDSICRWINVSPHSMDVYLQQVLGYSGDDILKVYRGGTALHFMEKYGIKL